jgi:hypothetical protein
MMVEQMQTTKHLLFAASCQLCNPLRSNEAVLGDMA